MADLRQPSLSDYPLFAGLSEAELALLSACLSKRVFGKDAFLYHPGNPAMNAYLVESGLVRLFFTDHRGREYLLNLLGPRSLVGLPMLYTDQVRELGAAAVLPTVAWVLSQEDLVYFAQRFPQLTQNIYRLMDRALRTLLRAFQIQVVLDIHGRLANLLLYLSSLGGEMGVRDEFNMPLSQADLARWLGASRGHLNRSLAHIQQLGLIRVEGQKLFILDRPGLLRLAEGVMAE